MRLAQLESKVDNSDVVANRTEKKCPLRRRLMHLYRAHILLTCFLAVPTCVLLTCLTVNISGGLHWTVRVLTLVAKRSEQRDSFR